MLHNSIDPNRLGKNIAAARRRNALTQEQLAERLGVSRQTLISLEGGQRVPSSDQLVRLGSSLSTTVRDLLNLEPVDEGVGVRFRRREKDEHVLNAVDALEEYGRRFVTLERLAEERLHRVQPPILSEKTRGLDGIAAENLASAERARLALGDGPLPDVRSILEEDVGLRIFGLRELEKTSVDGLFAYSEELGPLIGFNLKRNQRRNRWTLCHEYAHFLTNRFEVEVTDRAVASRANAKLEAFANRFAAAFLMPASGLSRRFSEMLDDSEGHFRVAQLVLLANIFGVSFEALVRRLEEIGRVKRGTYEDLISRGFRPTEAERALGIDRDAGLDERLPLRYVYLLAILYARGSIAESEVSRYLGVDRLTARELLDERFHDIEEQGVAFDESLEEAIV